MGKKTINVSDEVYEELNAIKEGIWSRYGDKVSFDEVLKSLLVQVNDLQEAMTDVVNGHCANCCDCEDCVEDRNFTRN